MTAVEVFAPAKVNLTLHVTGRRADGFHLLDTLVVFSADVGDRIGIVPGGELRLDVTGPWAQGVPAGDDNIVMRAARRLRALRSVSRGATITLEKHLPHSAGLGGGSSDAAAVLQSLAGLWGVTPLTGDEAVALGADLPMCLAATSLRARGIGDTLQPVALPPLYAVLTNPNEGVPTGAVFDALAHRENQPMPDPMPDFESSDAFRTWLKYQRNDLEPAARGIAGGVSAALAALDGLTGCQLARMSGSGSTCFGLFNDPIAACDAARFMQRTHRDWWVRDTRLGDVQRVT